MSLADIQGPVSRPTQKHDCKRSHRWVTRKYNRRCTRCGLEEMKDPVTCAWMPNEALCESGGDKSTT
jgi:hypothetical protein